MRVFIFPRYKSGTPEQNRLEEMAYALFGALQDAGLHTSMVGTYAKAGSEPGDTERLKSFDRLKDSLLFDGDGTLKLHQVSAVLPMTEVAGEIAITVHQVSLPAPAAEIEVDITNPEDPAIWARNVVSAISRELDASPFPSI